MHIDLHIGGKERIEQMICLLHLGLLSALENDLLTIEEAEVYLYSEYSLVRLAETGVEPILLDLVHAATELGVFATLYPQKLESEIRHLKQLTLHQLGSYEDVEISESYTHLDEWGHFIEVHMEGSAAQIERGLLLIALGFVTAMEQEMWFVRELYSNLFTPDCLSQIQEAQVDAKVLQLLSDLGHAKQTDAADSMGAAAPIYFLVDRVYRALSHYLMLESPEANWIAPTPIYPLPEELAGDLLHEDVIHHVEWGSDARTVSVSGLFTEEELEFHVQLQEVTEFHVQYLSANSSSHRLIVHPTEKETPPTLPFMPNLIVQTPTLLLCARAQRLVINGACYLLDTIKEPPE